MSLDIEDFFILFERKIIKEYGISYSEMQNIPFRTLWKWVEKDQQERQQREFNEMVKRHGSNNKR